MSSTEDDYVKDTGSYTDGLVVVNCHYCNSPNGSYQYDNEEHARLTQYVISIGCDPCGLSPLGGTGYHPDNPINPNCKMCEGKGEYIRVYD